MVIWLVHKYLTLNFNDIALGMSITTQDMHGSNFDTSNIFLCHAIYFPRRPYGRLTLAVQNCIIYNFSFIS